MSFFSKFNDRRLGDVNVYITIIIYDAFRKIIDAMQSYKIGVKFSYFYFFISFLSNKRIYITIL
jgi:hypothetical protein